MSDKEGRKERREREGAAHHHPPHRAIRRRATRSLVGDITIPGANSRYSGKMTNA